MSLEEQVVKMYEVDGMSTYQIAESLNTYPNKVRRILIKRGCKLKDKSEAQKNALKTNRVKHPTKGKKRSEKEKVKISASLTRHWDNLSEDERKRRVDMAKKNWEEMSPEQKQLMSELAIEGIRLAGKEGSKLEKVVLAKLGESGYAVQFHKKDLIVNEKLEIDLYIPELKTIIEIDGPSHFLPVWGEDKLQKQIRADIDKNGLILSKGFVVIRIKVMNSVSLKKQQDIIDFILEKLSEIKSDFPKETERYIEYE